MLQISYITDGLPDVCDFDPEASAKDVSELMLTHHHTDSDPEYDMVYYTNGYYSFCWYEEHLRPERTGYIVWSKNGKNLYNIKDILPGGTAGMEMMSPRSKSYVSINALPKTMHPSDLLDDMKMQRRILMKTLYDLHEIMHRKYKRIVLTDQELRAIKAELGL